MKAHDKLLPGFYFNELALYEEWEDYLIYDFKALYSLFDETDDQSSIEFLKFKEKFLNMDFNLIHFSVSK
mgnify:CR=1 FL=1